MYVNYTRRACYLFTLLKDLKYLGHSCYCLLYIQVSFNRNTTSSPMVWLDFITRSSSEFVAGMRLGAPDLKHYHQKTCSAENVRNLVKL